MISHLLELRVGDKTPTTEQVLRVVGLSSAAWYGSPRKVEQKARPGPKPRFSDEKVLEEVKAYLEDPVFTGEGYKKLVSRLKAFRGITVAKERLLRILGENGLLAGERPEPNGSSRVHDGVITTDAPDRMWGLDIKEWRCATGKLWSFTVIDHFNAEVIAERSCESATQDVAADVLRMAIKERFGSLEKGVCAELMIFLRTDHGSQFTSDAFTNYVTHEKEVRLSKDRKGRAVFNIFIERLWRSVKDEHVYLFPASDGLESYRGLRDYFEYYNQDRRHQSLDDETPISIYQESMGLAA